MKRWLLDTNIISELRKARPESRVIAFIQAQPLEGLYLSAVSIAEIRFGIEIIEDPIKRAELNDWLTLKVRPMFDGRILQVGEDVMFKWRLFVAEGRKINYTFSQPDLIIAATAQHYGLGIVTRNTTDYEKTRVPTFNPWVDCL